MEVSGVFKDVFMIQMVVKRVQVKVTGVFKWFSLLWWKLLGIFKCFQDSRVIV